MTEYEIGQKVWVVPSNKYSQPRADEITKIGRRWITLGGPRPQRFDPNTGRLDGGQYSSPGKIFHSKEAHAAYVARCERWKAIHERLRHSYELPTHLTDDDLDTLARVMRVT